MTIQPAGAPLLNPGFNLTLRPMRYPEFYEMYKNAIKNTWTVDEVDFSTDVTDLAQKMGPGDRHLIQRLVAFFATGGSIVSNICISILMHQRRECISPANFTRRRCMFSFT
jgi:ribonucleoside-diphosphate reductase beta chain